MIENRKVTNMARFRNLEIAKHYDIISGETGYWLAQSIQGCDAMATDQAWSKGDEAWPAQTTEFEGKPDEIAE